MIVSSTLARREALVPEPILNSVKGRILIPRRRDQLLLDDGVHQDLQKTPTPWGVTIRWMP
jgi:hypothetical protein